MRALLDQRHTTTTTVVDLIRGALDAHLDPSAQLGETDERAVRTRPLRLATRMAFWSFPAFLLVWGVLRLLDPDGPWSPALGVAVIGRPAGTVGAVASVASMLSAVAAGVLLAAARLRPAGPIGTRITRALPPILPPVLVAVLFILHAVVLRGLPWWGVPPHVVFWTGTLIFPLVIGRAVARDDLNGYELHAAMLLAAIVAICMAAQIGLLVIGPMVAGPAWQTDLWSAPRLLGYAVLALPVLTAGRAIRSGVSGLRARAGA
jgi:hypothetical protein